jgi:hypothetical protein
MSFFNAMASALGKVPFEQGGFEAERTDFTGGMSSITKTICSGIVTNACIFDLYAGPYLRAKKAKQRPEPTLYERWLQRPYED